MKLLTCLITHNRLAYTQRTLDSFLKTIDVPYYLVIVDDASTDGSLEWLKTQGFHLLQNDENMYPGYACNRGWANGRLNYPEATHYMRLDNDMEFADKWAMKAEEYFKAFPDLGQLGLDYTALADYNSNPDYVSTSIRWSKTDIPKQINLWPGNVGGPCIIPKKLYDEGIRYNESPWHHDGGPRPTAQEDARMSMEILVKGYKVGHATEKLAWTFANESNRNDYPEYYEKTMKIRGYV